MQKHSLNIMLLLTLLTTILLSLTLPIYSQGDVRERIDASIESTGGNLYLKASFEGDGLKSVDVIEVKIPETFLDEKGFLRVYTGQGGDRKEIEFQYTGDILRVDTDEINNILVVEIYIPEATIPESRGRYKVGVLSYIDLNIPISQVEFEFRPALDTKAVENLLPPGFTQVKSSPEGVTPEQYEVSRVLSETDILLLGDTEITDFIIEQISEERISLILADTEVYTLLDTDASGSIRGVMNITISNTDLITWPTDTEIFFNKTYRIQNMRTQLGKPVDFEFTGRVYKVQLPYALKPNETITFIIDFTFEEGINVSAGLTPFVKFTLTLPPPTTIPIDKMIVEFPEINFREELEYYTDFSTPLILEGEVQITLTDILEDYGISYILSLIIIVGTTMAAYTRIRKLLLKDLPENVLEFINEYKVKIELMKNILELEKRYSQGELTSREYSKERNKLERKMREFDRKLSTLKREVEKAAEENEEVKMFIKDLEDLDETWKKLRELDEKRRKKTISPDQYKTDREELLTRFEILINKVVKRA